MNISQENRAAEKKDDHVEEDLKREMLSIQYEDAKSHDNFEEVKQENYSIDVFDTVNVFEGLDNSENNTGTNYDSGSFKKWNEEEGINQSKTIMKYDEDIPGNLKHNIVDSEDYAINYLADYDQEDIEGFPEEETSFSLEERIEAGINTNILAKKARVRGCYKIFKENKHIDNSIILDTSDKKNKTYLSNVKKYAKSQINKKYPWTDIQMLIISECMKKPLRVQRSNTEILKQLQKAEAKSDGIYPSTHKIGDYKTKIQKFSKEGRITFHGFSGALENRLTHSAIGNNQTLDIQTKALIDKQANPKLVNKALDVESNHEAPNMSTSLPDFPKLESTMMCTPCGDETSIPAILYCSTCKEYMCAQCGKTHSRLKMTRGHLVTKVEEVVPIRDSRIFCTSCQEEARTEEAVSYCATCQDYFCTGCTGHHARFKATKSHQINNLQALFKPPPAPLPATSPSNQSKVQHHQANMIPPTFYNPGLLVQSPQHQPIYDPRHLVPSPQYLPFYNPRQMVQDPQPHHFLNPGQNPQYQPFLNPGKIIENSDNKPFYNPGQMVEDQHQNSVYQPGQLVLNPQHQQQLFYNPGQHPSFLFMWPPPVNQYGNQ